MAVMVMVPVHVEMQRQCHPSPLGVEISTSTHPPAHPPPSTLSPLLQVAVPEMAEQQVVTKVCW
jgi:hypothetical protein